MNNYTHPYSDYVNHILNKSPSKNTYSFAKAQRFPQKVSQIDYLEFDQPPTQETYRNTSKFSPEKRQKSPIRTKDSERRPAERGLNHRHERTINSHVGSPFESSTRIKNESRSKSPIRSIHPFPQHQNSMQGHQKSTRLAREYSNYEDPYPKQNHFKRSPSKSPIRHQTNSRNSPTKTFTQRLQDQDHASKNITINGYYPTGIELNAEGKSPISTQRSTASYSFGRSSEKQRYKYMVKSEDTLGPGYYDNFSEFGQQRKY